MVCDAFGTRPIQVSWQRQQPSGEMSAVPLDMGGTLSSVVGPGGNSNGWSTTYRGLPTASRFMAFQKDYEDTDKRTVFELHILNSQLNDSSLYVCKVFNEYGEDAHNIELTVLGK